LVIQAPTPATAIRTDLKSQYHAALAMLRQAIELSPDASWVDSEHTNAPWQIAYHTLFFAHLYLQPNSAAFRPWEHHQGDCQVPDGIPGPPDPDSPLPLLPEPYAKQAILSYWHIVDAMVDETVDALDVLSAESGFDWYPISKLEHQIVNLRHIQHGAAQLADRVRAARGVGIEWVGARPSGSS